MERKMRYEEPNLIIIMLLDNRVATMGSSDITEGGKLPFPTSVESIDEGGM